MMEHSSASSSDVGFGANSGVLVDFADKQSLPYSLIETTNQRLLWRPCLEELVEDF